MRKIFTLLLLLLVCWVNSALAQGQAVSGKVTAAENGLALPGVSVVVKGTTTGIATDGDGSYQLRVPGSNATLVFRFLGYETREVVVGNQQVINVSLNLDSKSLDEVVVTALGIERSERSLGYATQEVQGEKLTLTKEQNVIGSLAGKIAGVQVTGASGASMGGTQKIKIRGVNSLTGTDQPLIVIDGTPISNANFAGRNGGDYGNLAQDINPEDIESVNVLKGPAASALYGIRGQYGVIMITTKKGARGPKAVQVQLNSAFSVERVGNFMPLQDLYGGGGSQTWRTLPNGDKYVDMSYDESWGPRMDGTPVRQVFSFYPQDPEYGKLTPFVPHPDNIKDFFETGHTINNGVSITGGNENSTFRLSYNNTQIEGVEPNTWLKRNNFGLSAGLDLTKKLTASANVNYANNYAQRPSQGYDGGSRYLVQWFQRNMDMNRLKNYRYDDGTFLHWNLRRPNSSGEITNFEALYWNNPYFEAYENYSNDNRDRLFGDVGLTYQLLPELKLSGFIRGDLYTQNIETREAVGGRYVPAYTVGKYQNKEVNYEFLGTYSKEWGDFSLNANVGTNLYTRRYSSVYQESEGGLSSPGYYNIAASIDRPTNRSYLLRKEIRSFYGMASFGYKDTYFIDASLRNDNSSTLPEDNNSYWYPSISGSFVFSDMLAWNPLSFGKLRVSYAQAGSDLDAYQTAFTYAPGGIYDGVNSLYVPDNLINPDIEPSFAHSYEAGVDLKFFQNRLGMGLTYYMQKNKNQIINLDVSGTSGYSSTIINAGLIENKGIELSLTATPVQSEIFSWDATFNFNKNESMVKELGSESGVYAHDMNTYSRVSVYLNSYEGQSFGSLIGKAYQRDPATGKILLGTNNLPLYTEANHNFGSVLPDFTGGFQNYFRFFGKVDLGAMIDYQVGGQFFSWSRMLAVKTGMAEETAALNDNGKNVRDPLREGGGVKVTGISAESGEEVTAYVDARAYYRTTLGTHVYEEWLYDASYVKLREVRLGYNLDKKTIGWLPFERANIALIARNPAMIWQKAPKGLDPSELSTGSSPISWLETGSLNTVRSYGVNLNITF
ncbi:TonB-linked SusC/RagA family outer membrane protein [Pontibacter ummariensis]|uniref:TonB-linked outer membrane protein, SusC/RagA family n=1 Tax=Pontibacter ummariensis TaxID=1610492 RepID=A0A239D360_9BACT|nr:SusC/RagA family TonB-linked outer membrane protein [Pontibacter ummariensis]PRY14219.1 TonB-linked SusC/RagA family outer membrane protein [Pontibacter ummariensis]SNS26737.1 TonB-linked outer membrane protein, SusC/RagA family [Pontibacter ummariensis]